MTATSELNLDRVVDALDRLNVKAYVEQTGGGTATLYAEPIVGYHECTCKPAYATTAVLTTHDPGCPVPEKGGSPRYAAVAGPGSYGWGKRDSIADLDDFYVGIDDDGETSPISPQEVGATTVDDVAKLIAAQVEATTTKPIAAPLDADAIDALGFDSTGRSMPADARVRAEEGKVYTAAANASNRALIAQGVEDRYPRNEAAGRAAVEQYRVQVTADPDGAHRRELGKHLGHIAASLGQMFAVWVEADLPADFLAGSDYPFHLSLEDMQAEVAAAAERLSSAGLDQ